MRSGASRDRAVRRPRAKAARNGIAYRAAEIMTTVRVSRERIDRLLLERRLAESREKAQALIMAGEVLVDGRKAHKPGEMVPVSSNLEVLSRPRFVGRGGIKLQYALEHFNVNPLGM